MKITGVLFQSGHDAKNVGSQQTTTLQKYNETDWINTTIPFRINYVPFSTNSAFPVVSFQIRLLSFQKQIGILHLINGIAFFHDLHHLVNFYSSDES